MQHVLTPELILDAYSQGLFPMAYSAESPYVHWVCPEDRGQLSITDIHFPRRLIKTIRNEPYRIKINADFSGVVAMCGENTPTRPETWINDSIRDVFIKLHKMGHAHSVEAWNDEGELVGGLYGLAMGGAFFGESMFSRATDASKITLAHLVARLWKGGFVLLDTQFVNEHLEQFGVYEVTHEQYLMQLTEALSHRVDFCLSDDDIDEGDLVRAYFEMRKSQG
ncbi:MAG: leucyl/phenylalanyl-tRNA--protein transferase [Alphaproteobacteria bacterium]|nr:leucyl/phenylalanyl-tRNA--protein transferase [Alphaproteobacteria bacterium]